MAAQPSERGEPLRIFSLVPRRCRHGTHRSAVAAEKCLRAHPEEWGFEIAEEGL